MLPRAGADGEDQTDFGRPLPLRPFADPPSVVAFYHDLPPHRKQAGYAVLFTEEWSEEFVWQHATVAQS